MSVVGEAPDGITPEQMADALDASLATWSEVDCAELTLTATDDEPDLRVTWVRDWSSRGLDPDAPGTTELSYRTNERGWVIESAAILLNTEHHRWAAAPGSLLFRDVQAVLTHELGHALGLLHVCEEGGQSTAPRCTDDASFLESAMYPSYLGTQQREPSADDVAGLCFLYGEASVSPGADPDAGVDGGVDPIAPVSLLGDPCSEDAQCGAGTCGAGGYCTTVCGPEQSCAPGFTCGGGDFLVAECVSELGMFGASCTEAEGCMTGLCIVEGADGTCTRSCDSGCPGGYQCKAAGERSICVPRVQSGCSLAVTRVQGVSWLFLGFLSALYLRRARKKRCRVS